MIGPVSEQRELREPRVSAMGLDKARYVMAKKSGGREDVWLQCTETGDLNYRTNVNVKGGLPEKIKEGIKKYSPRLRRHTVHKIKRK